MLLRDGLCAVRVVPALRPAGERRGVRHPFLGAHHSGAPAAAGFGDGRMKPSRASQPAAQLLDSAPDLDSLTDLSDLDFGDPMIDDRDWQGDTSEPRLPREGE